MEYKNVIKLVWKWTKKYPTVVHQGGSENPTVLSYLRYYILEKVCCFSHLHFEPFCPYLSFQAVSRHSFHCPWIPLCSRNCYLGNSFFSAPLLSNHWLRSLTSAGLGRLVVLPLEVRGTITQLSDNIASVCRGCHLQLGKSCWEWV